MVNLPQTHPETSLKSTTTDTINVAPEEADEICSDCSRYVSVLLLSVISPLQLEHKQESSACLKMSCYILI